MYRHRFSRRILPPEKYIIQGILKPEHKPKRKKQLVKNPRPISSGSPHTGICDFCDFRDKHSAYCLIKRLGNNCPYTNGSAGYVAFKLFKS